MKNILFKLSLLGLFVFSVLLFLPKSSYAADLKIVPSSSTFDGVGDTKTIEVKLDLDSGEEVDGVEIYLQYNSVKLEFVSIEEDDYFNNYFDLEGGSGEVKIVAVQSQGTDPKTEDGVIATMIFKAKSEGSASLEFTEDTAVLETGTAADILDNSTNGSYTIEDSGDYDGDNDSDSDNDVAVYTYDDYGIGGGSSSPDMPESGHVSQTLMLLLGGLSVLGIGLKLRKII